jgi:FtsH-binding integral membrane protein
VKRLRPLAQAAFLLAVLGLALLLGAMWWWALFGLSEPIAMATSVTGMVGIFAGMVLAFGADW